MLEEEISNKINNRFIPLISKIKGFVDYCLFPNKDILISMSAFQEKKGADEYVPAAADFVTKNPLQYFTEKPEILSGLIYCLRFFQQEITPILPQTISPSEL